MFLCSFLIVMVCGAYLVGNAFTIKEYKQVLVVQEKRGRFHGIGYWKLPSGVVDAVCRKCRIHSLGNQICHFFASCALFLLRSKSKNWKLKQLRRRNIQKMNLVVLISYFLNIQKEESGFDHQEVAMPSVPPPDKLLSMEELPERCLTDPRLPKTYRNKIATTKFTPWPIEIRFCELTTSTNQTKSPPSLNFWFRAKGKLSDDQALHRCVVAFASDLIFLQVALNPHRKQGMKASSIFSPSAYNARGTVTGQMFNQKREGKIPLIGCGGISSYILLLLMGTCTYSTNEEVDVRIVDDDVTIKLFQRKKINCLLSVAKFLDELQLELHHVAGGHVGKYYSFLFNSKIIEGSSVYASAIANSVIYVMDTQYAAAVPHTGSY
ncbi:hypothetical protein Ahy_A04g018548 isoform B [Arachis hypogaea]|uniref:Acyl-CoA thioesterase 2 C-terminal domain-containing protein n=1 Tax=Arachis hypogaea TaxID=3818 RepID=A0A445DDX3_ARAHY|nr:hypothetical protein Ahy_A04g018548 isoform B [Arachis hypogaea]